MDAALIDVEPPILSLACYPHITENTLLSLMLLDETISPSSCSQEATAPLLPDLAVSYLHGDLAELMMFNDSAMAPGGGLQEMVPTAAPSTTDTEVMSTSIPTVTVDSVISSGVEGGMGNEQECVSRIRNDLQA